MDKELIDEVKLFPLKKINVTGGNVLHALKKSDSSFTEFGEAYFSFIENQAIKAWKRHRKMTLNLIVPIGEVQFVIYDEKSDRFLSKVLSPENYKRLTIPPNLWFGFKGLSKDTSMLLNIADIEHDPAEVDSLILNEIEYDWR